jgi:hypothetical protein
LDEDSISIFTGCERKIFGESSKVSAGQKTFRDVLSALQIEQAIHIAATAALPCSNAAARL